ncbi:hypothetical protein G6F68_012760 [Rhizopus microsporus]|nr:hypothetical protein G6F68_012760 [Rhizopus microsporus]
MRPISNDKRNNIRQLLLENKTGAEISQRTGVSTGTISNIRSELDLPNEPMVSTKMLLAQAGSYLRME